jgi:hypothetical protein
MKSGAAGRDLISESYMFFRSDDQQRFSLSHLMIDTKMIVSMMNMTLNITQ